MNFQWQKRLICYTFIAILLISGMHVKLNTSHSYFACKSNPATESQTYTRKETFVSNDYCTIEFLQPRTFQYIKNNSTNNLVIRKIQNFLFFSLNVENYLETFYSNEYYLTKALPANSSKAIIIDYIHRQDGAK